MSPFIFCEGLSKTYRIRKRNGGWLKSFIAPRIIPVEALRTVSFQIEQGELVGYIGPNGAGKSTTVKILSGILTPDEGVCSVLGWTPWRERMRLAARIGVVFGQRSQLWWDLPVIDSFVLLRDIYRVSKADYRRNLDELVGRLSLAPLLATPVRQLSLGQRMRCELASSMLHSPEILFLDEPTIGLDAVSKLAVREFIRDLNRERGLTAILTTHDMDDIQALCSRVMLIGQGSLLMDGSVQALLASEHERRIVATLERPFLAEWLPAHVTCQQGFDNEWTLLFDPTLTPAAALIALLNEKCGIVDVMVENPPIDVVVARRYAQIDTP